ncbi:response regulator [Azospirillum sp. sgz301742]
MPTILVAEDDPMIRMLVVELLSMDYEVCEAENAQAAMDILSQPKDIDLLFSDIVMPGRMHGVELAQQAQRIRPGLKVLLTTGYDRQALQSKNIDTTIPILRKPYTNKELFSTIAAYFQ